MHFLFESLLELSAAPTNLKVTVISGYVLNASWTGIPRDEWNGWLARYDICSTKKKIVCDEGRKESTSSSSTYFEIKKLTPHTTYTIAVRAVNDAGEGPWSTAVKQTTPEERE